MSLFETKKATIAKLFPEANIELIDKINNLSQEELDDLIWELDKDNYEQRPVDIDTFLESPTFMGNHFADERTGECKVYPFWREKLREIYPSPFYNGYNEAIVMLGIGNGKSTVSNISCLYEIYKVLCLKHPQTYYKLMKSTIITFVIFSANKYTAENVNWPQLKAAFEDSPWFQEHCPIVEEGKRVALDKDNCVTLPKGVAIQLGSNEKHALGKAVIWGVVDEANFQSENSHQAYNSYNAIAQRRTSRFQSADFVPGVLWIVSSPKSDLDFVAKRIETQKKQAGTLIVKDIPSWEIKPDAGRSGKTFKLFLGDTTADPKIIEEGDDTSEYNPSKILDVPVEFRSNFEKDLIKAIMDIAGRSSVSDFALFPNVSKITSIAKVPPRVGCEVMLLTSGGVDEIVDSVDQNYFLNLPHKHCHRYIHIDVGLRGDRFAMASTYSYDLGKELAEVDIIQASRTYITEFVLFAKNADKSKEVPLIKIIKFLRWLKEIDYPVKVVSYDVLGRGMFAQMINEIFPTKYLSVDRSKEQYLSMRNLINEGYLMIPNNKLLIKEIIQLRDVGPKIDHPENTGYDKNGNPIFSKDGADAVCGSVYSASTDDEPESASLLGSIGLEDFEEDTSPYKIKTLMRDSMNSSFASFFG